ncbi:MAG: D-alanyl-D-alanine carboxypeptidase [Acidobacteriota bacterium]
MMRVAALVLLAAGCLPAADLDKKLAALVEAGPMVTGGALGVHVVNLTTGKSVYAFNESLLFLPASNMKLFTAALTLSRLGGEYRYETKLVREESGSLVLVGSGDPSMSMRGYPFGAAAQTPLRAIEELVEQAIAAGLRQVDGDVVGDDRRYPWSPYPESWTADDARRDFGAPVSALALDDNAVAIVVRPGVRAGELAHVELTPEFEYFTISNRVTTIAGTSDQVRVVRVPDRVRLS